MKKFIRDFCLMLTACAVCVLSGRVCDAAEIDTVAQNVYIGMTDVSGMTAAEVDAFLDRQVQEYDGVMFTLFSAEDLSAEAFGYELGLHVSDSDLVDEVMAYGKKGTPLARYLAKKNASGAGERKVFDYHIEADPSAVREIIEANLEGLTIPAIDDTLERVDGEFITHDGQNGVSVDVAASVETVCSYIADMWNGADSDIQLVTTVKEPRGGAGALSKVKDVLGTFTTDYSTSSSNRCANVANATGFINGTLIYPGEEFSVAKCINPMTAENGYELAGSYENGRTVETYGGGICQVSTTLYNAVLLSELEVVTRYNHSMLVSYVKPSMDAAISGDVKDFVFSNNTDYPIYIEGITGNKKVTFTIYGCDERPENRKVIYESETLDTTEKEVKVVLDPASPIGFVHKESGHMGCKAQLWKVVEVDGVEVSRDLVNKSSYMMSPQATYIGTAGASPDLLAQLYAYAEAGDGATCVAIVSGAGQPAPPPVVLEVPD